MKTEKIVKKISNLCLNVVANRVESLRINDSTQNTVRVYDKGMIGVAGSVGEADFAALEAAATEHLSQNIEYPETHAPARTIDIDTAKPILEAQDFIPAIQHFLDRLSAENPQFLFGNKVQLNSSRHSYENSDGERYTYRGNQLAVVLTIKYKGSANIMDESYACESDRFDEDAICRDVAMKCNAFLNALPHVEEDEVTVIGDLTPLQFAVNHLVADLYFNNASLLSGKLGEKLFHEQLSVVIDRDPAHVLDLPFFDAEGVVNDGYVKEIIEKGVLKRLLTTKRSAARYHTENIGSASAPYNGVPNIGGEGFDVLNTAEDLAALVKGRAVYLSDTSGGDMTPSGDMSMPVLTSYLYEDGNLLGKLPEYALSANLFDLLGKDFIGVTEKGLFGFGKQKYFVYRAKIVNKA